ncbi:MAG: aldehyde dehydrogenase family protein [Rhodobacteraceae bacterium]|nr:aldehyde dehydrogenase family protein [Paracoccaceae bacterium]
MADVNPYWQNYIDGAWVDGGAGRIDVTDPATGDRIAEHALADAADVDRAVGAARRVHLSGALTAMRPIERGRMVQAVGRYLLKHKDEIARLLTLEQGKPLWESHIEVEGAALYFEYYGNQASTVEGRSIPLGAGYMDWTEYEPFGVSAQIIPWNYPVEMTARSLSAALATGNACVIKSPELTPLTNAWLAKAAEAAGFPTGAVNVICGLGRDAGAALAGHRDVNQIVFTGSVPTGIAIATAAAQNVVPCVLELGGKSAAIVHADADLDAFENDIRWGIYFNAGQVCSAMSRVIVHESRHDELVERAQKVAKSLSVGPGIERTEFGANMGSMVSDGQRDRALGLIARAQEQGAKIAAGGRKPNRPGAFLEPTVVSGVTPNMDIAQQEVFGPVLSVLSFGEDAQAIEIANGTDYGLVAGVFTADLDRATLAARQLRAGQVFVNEWYAGGVETPFGGFGKSGYGREKGREALWNYVQTKNIAIRLKG